MATDTNTLAKRPESRMSSIRSHILSPEVKNRFTDMMGKNAIYYLNQVLILVANNEELQKCTPESILISAMRAASLKLSVDPAKGQAWIIPYSGIATFQIGYKGVYELAMRTHQYRFINVIPIFEGETLVENRYTGIHVIGGHRTSDKVIARMLYFQLRDGFEKTFVMTVEQIDQHARHYSKAYNNRKSKWNDPDERPKMEDKTVLINGLRKWGRFNEMDLETLEAIENEQGWNGPDAEIPGNGEFTGVDGKPVDQMSEEEIMGSLNPEWARSGEKNEPTTSEKPEDPKAETTQAGEQEPETDQTAEQPPTDPLRLQPEALKAALESRARTMTGTIKQTQKGLIATTLEAALSFTTDPKASRKILLKYLTGHDSLTELTDGMLLALYAWLKPYQEPASGEWFAEEMSVREAVAAFNQAQPAQPGLL